MLDFLSLQHFRSYIQQDFTFSLPNTAFIAPNGTGKTNILEAIRLLSVGSTWRASGIGPVVAHKQEFATLFCTYNDDNYLLALKNRSRTLKKNEKNQTWKNHLGKMPSILFAPEILSLFTGSKSSRLRFFDQFLIQISPTFRDSYSQAMRLIRQKHTELKQVTPNKTLLHSYNLLLTPLLPVLYQERTKLLQLLLPFLRQAHQKMTSKQDDIRLALAIANWTPNKEPIEQKLEEMLALELNARRVLVGPHRDDFLLLYHGVAQMQAASRGEIRTLTLCLLYAMRYVLEEKLQKTPLFLLDDVFSELDASRQEFLQHLCQNCQTFLTSTHESHLKNWENTEVMPLSDVIPFVTMKKE